MQNHYIEVAQGSSLGQDRIDCEYLACIQKKNWKNWKNWKKNSKRDIMQLFSADATIFKKN